MFFARTQQPHNWRSPRYQFTPRQTRTWRELWRLAQGQARSQTGDSSPTATGLGSQSNTESQSYDAFSTSPIQVACIDFCIELLNQRIGASEYESRLPQNPNGPGPNPDPTPIGLGFGSKGPTPCWVGSARSDPNGFWGPKWGYKQDKQTKIFRCITYTFFSCKFRYLIYSHFHKSGNNSAGRDNRSLSSNFIHINTTNDTQTDHLPCFSAFVLTP